MEPFDTSMPSNKTLNETKEDQRKKRVKGILGEVVRKWRRRSRNRPNKSQGKGIMTPGNDPMGHKYGSLQSLPLAEVGE
jgi:hypothetical protein